MTTWRFSCYRKCLYTENLQLCKNYVGTKWYDQSIRFCINCGCSICVSRASVPTFSCFKNSSDACASFSLLIETNWRHVGLILLVASVIARKFQAISDESANTLDATSWLVLYMLPILGIWFNYDIVTIQRIFSTDIILLSYYSVSMRHYLCRAIKLATNA